MVKNLTRLGLISVAFACAMPVLADDSPSAPPVQSAQQKMDQCIAKHRAADASLTDKQAKKTCAREAQMLQNHPSIPPSRENIPQS